MMGVMKDGQDRLLLKRALDRLLRSGVSNENLSVINDICARLHRPRMEARFMGPGEGWEYVELTGDKA